MAAEMPNAGNSPIDPKPASPVVGLLIPLLLILAAGGVFTAFYFLNQNLPAPLATPTTATDGR
ncbi:MAG: hypothetical protein MUF18_12825 [Fimbriiglobus sp.]|nr:hypothetical protein [Fimbriiglobus sp.]